MTSDGPSRRSIDVGSFAHTNPIPAACRVGPLLVSSVVSSRDPGSTSFPDDIAAQIANLFHHVDEILREAGAGWEHIARMSFYLPSLDQRAELNGPWLQHFPDPASRPARHTQLSSAGYAQCEFIAYVT